MRKLATITRREYSAILDILDEFDQRLTTLEAKLEIHPPGRANPAPYEVFKNYNAKARVEAICARVNGK